MITGACLSAEAPAFGPAINPERLLAAAAIILLLAGCAEKPLVISADTSCEKFRHISATDEQIKVFADNWSVMEPYADQILTHNAVYDAACLKADK